MDVDREFRGRGMKIGIDARLLSRPLTGIGRYTLEMCRSLAKTGDASLYLYSPAPLRAEVMAGLEAATVRTRDWESGLLRQFWSESYLPWWAKADRVDLLWGPAHRLPRWLPADMARVVTIHDLVWRYAGETMRPLSRLLERYQMPMAVGSADVIVVDSQATADALRNEYVTEDSRVAVVYPGAPLVTNTPPIKSLHKLGIDGPYILFVGTLEPRKNLVRLLTAYAALPLEVRAQAMMVIVGGSGWGRDDLQGLIERLAIGKHIRLTGYIDEPTLASLYTHARFLAMPSLYEGFGLPLVEAMAHGTPVMTANNSSMPEVAGSAGLLVDAGDVNSIRDGLMKMMGDDALRDRLAANARVSASRFDWDASARQLISVFQHAITLRAGCH